MNSCFVYSLKTECYNSHVHRGPWQRDAIDARSDAQGHALQVKVPLCVSTADLRSTLHYIFLTKLAHTQPTGA
jgi:hypothetical protein